MSSSLEKTLSRAVESIRLVQSSPGPQANITVAFDGAMTNREKLTQCRALCAGLCAPAARERTPPAHFAKCLTVAVELFLALLDDPAADVRMAAGECLARIVSALAETHAGRLQVELYKELKKGGSARRLSAAMAQFSRVAPLIRPQKGRAFVTNLLPCVVRAMRRQEEAVHEALADAMPKIFKALGHFANENEVRILLKTCLGNLFDSNPAVRRATARCLVSICDHALRPALFLPWLLAALVDFLVPSPAASSTAQAEETPVDRILGILGCARLIIPRLCDLKEESSGPDEVNLLEKLLQLYELCLHYCRHRDHNVVSHSLETLLQLLRTPPPSMRERLTSPTGISRSYVFDSDGSQQKGASNVGGDSLSSASRLSLMISEEEEGLLELEPGASEAAPIRVGGNLQMMDAPPPSTPQEARSPPSPAAEMGNPSDDVPLEEFGGDGASVAASEEGPRREEDEEEEEESEMLRHQDHEDAELEEEMNELENIGGFCDADVPLIYCARKLVLSFLLTREKGQLAPNSRSRISIKVLALSCLTAMVRLTPKVFLLPLMCDRDDDERHDAAAEDRTPLIRDVAGYVEHEDPQVRGAAVILLGALLKGALVEAGGGSLREWFNGRRPDHADIVATLKKKCGDPSPVALRMVVSSAALFARQMLLSPSHALAMQLLRRAVDAAADCGYWLVKVELCRMVAGLPFDALHFCSGGTGMQDKLVNVIMSFLEDEDSRVRTEAAATLPEILPRLCEAVDENGNDAVSATAVDMSRRLLHPILTGLRHERTFASRSFVKASEERQSGRLGRRGRRRGFAVVTELHRRLQTSQRPHLTSGCVEALSALCERFPPARHPAMWGAHRPRTRRASAANVDKVLASPASSLLGLALSLLAKSQAAHDLTCHAHLLTLARGLLASLAVSQRGREPRSPDSSSSSQTDSLELPISALLHHSVRLLAMASSVMDETTPAPEGQSKVPLSSIATPALSPLKTKKVAESLAAKEAGKAKPEPAHETQKKLGYFSHSPHYVRLFETLKSAYHVHMNNPSTATPSKFDSMLVGCLDALTCVLDVCDGSVVARHIEEVLGYLKTVMSGSPLSSLRCVQFLLKCIFKTNFASDPDGDDEEGDGLNSVASSPASSLMQQGQKGVFHPCFDVPRNELVHTFHLARDSTSGISGDDGSTGGLFSSGRGRTMLKKPPIFKALSKTADRAALASYVRLFEPVVIKALKHYTLTTDADQQGAVLQLLVQLVRLRVNYCLLDSDQIFINYVVRQLEPVEEGQVPGAQQLVARVFQFLVLLSYERYHSKPIIGVAKILRLCEGLFASGQDAEAVVLPALLPLAEDLFCYRGVVASPGMGEDDLQELEAQRESALGMLLKLAVHPAALRCLVMVLAALRSEGEEKWRRASRTVMDVLLPLLANQKVDLKDKPSMDLVLRAFAALSPACLRPVDPFLSAVLTCAVDLSDLEEVQRWLAFVAVALPIITHQSPEEAILSRLEELGIQVGAGSLPSTPLLNTSIDSSSSTISDPLGVAAATGTVRPEVTLARFLIQVVGAACGKLHQLVFSQTECDASFLRQELSHLLLFLGYLLQSGRYPRISAAAQTLAARGAGDDLMYTVEGISELFLQVSHAAPFLTLQWLHVLILLNWCPQEFWCKVLEPRRGVSDASGEPDSLESPCLHREIVRRGALILYSDFLCDHTSAHVEGATWLVVQHAREVVASFAAESPVQDFVMSMHASPSSSGLLLQAVVSSCREGARDSPSFLRNALRVAEPSHPSQTGALLLFLLRRYLCSPLTALARQANAVACAKAEAVLRAANAQDAPAQMMSEAELAEALELLRRSGGACKRYGRLVSLLNRLSADYYDLSPIEGDESRTFNPAGASSAAAVDKEWYKSQVRAKCCSSSASTSDASVCAELLSALDYPEIAEIADKKDFELGILVHGLSRCATVESSAGKNPTKERLSSPVFLACRDSLCQHVKALTEALPKPVAVYNPGFWSTSPVEAKYSHRMEASFQTKEFREHLALLMEPYAEFLSDPTANSSEFLEKDQDVKIAFGLFGLLSLEFVKWLVSPSCDDSLSRRKEDFLQLGLRAAAAALRCPATASAWLAADTAWPAAVSAALCVHAAFRELLRIPSSHLAVAESLSKALKAESLESLPCDAMFAPPPPHSAVLACVKLAECFDFVISKPSEFSHIAKDLSGPLEDVILGLCRMPVFSSYVRVPPEVWKMNFWDVQPTSLTIFPIPPVELLQENDILRDYLRRASVLGWLNRQQFEELWVSLLGVFGVSSAEEPRGEEESKALAQCSANIVHALTAVVMQTTLLPLPGQANLSKPIHNSRDHPSQFLLSPRGQQLTAIQNYIQFAMENESGPTTQYHHLKVDSSVNLERCVGPGSTSGPAQVSVSYIMSAIRHHSASSDEKSDSRSNKSSSALALPFILREEALAASGVDVQSCLHFLIDLYSQWLSGSGVETAPLLVLTEMVRSVLMLTDLFTETKHFQWVFNSLSELHRSHPPEDELLNSMLCLGMCKAAAVTGADQDTLDRLRRTVESSLRSAHLPAKLCALHGLLYLLQSEVAAPAMADLTAALLPLAADYLRAHLQDSASPLGQCEAHTALVWAAAFYVMENFEHELQDKSFTSNTVNLAVSLAGQTATPHGLYLLLLNGLERLVVGGKLGPASSVMRLATDLLTETNPALTIPAVQLFLAGMYASTGGAAHVSIETPSGGIEDPERLMQAMEQMSILFDCVRRSGRREAALLCRVLPRVLVDFFPAADVVNRAISTFISPGQPHQVLLAGVLFRVFQQAAKQEQSGMLQEWVLMALPNFTRRSPLSHSLWCLSVFFVSASAHSPWLQHYFPQLQHRFGYLDHEDRKLFCLAAREFYTSLKEEEQRTKFLDAFESAAADVGILTTAAVVSPYREVLEMLRVEKDH